MWPSPPEPLTAARLTGASKTNRRSKDKALEDATVRARAQAAVLAKGMGVKLGALIYVSNQVSTPITPVRIHAMELSRAAAAPAPPLAIEPHKVERTANVYAVFAIE